MTLPVGQELVETKQLQNGPRGAGRQQLPVGK